MTLARQVPQARQARQARQVRRVTLVRQARQETQARQARQETQARQAPAGDAGPAGPAGPSGSAGDAGDAEGGHLRIVHNFIANLNPRTEHGAVRDVDTGDVLAVLSYSPEEADGIDVTWVVNPKGELSDEWDLAKFFTGGGDDVGYLFDRKTNGKPNIKESEVSASISGSMLSVTAADTAAYKSRMVPVRVVDRLVKDSYINDAGNYVEAVYEDEFSFTVTARRNRKPELGDNRSLGTEFVGTQASGKKNEKSVTITKEDPSDKDTSSAHFIDDDDDVTYMSDSNPSRASFANGKITGKGSTWETDKHVPLVMGISAVDSGMLETATIPLKIVVDGAPAPAGGDPSTVIDDSRTAESASFNWWQFFEDKEGGFSQTAEWSDLALPTGVGAFRGDGLTDALPGSVIPGEGDDAVAVVPFKYSLRAWSSDPRIVVVKGNEENKVTHPLVTEDFRDAETGESDGVLRFVGNSVGEAMVTVVLTEPAKAVYSVTSEAQDKTDYTNLVHAGLGQHAVKRFMVKVVETDTTDR